MHKSLFIVAILALVFGVAPADAVDDFVRAEMKRQRVPGLALAVVRDGRITKATGYGLADLDNDVPVTADTVFELASITKQFTASLVMMLVEEGKVRLDDKAVQYLDGAPSAWNGITVRHLLNHTAGLAPLGKDFASMVRLMDIPTEKMYEAAKADPMGTAPGQKWDYSDVGYFLLGMIIEKVTGKTYADALSERILVPLGMSSSRMLDLNRPYKRLAKGYTLVRKDGGWETVNIRRDTQRGLASHYGLFSSVKDLARWDAALYTDSPLKQSTLWQMWTPTVLNDGRSFPYGFGWNVSSRNGHERVYHGGITGTFILRVPSLRLTVIVLTNLGRWSSGEARGVDALLLAHGVASLVEPKLRLAAINDADPALVASAREAFVSLSVGQLPGALFSVDAVRLLTPDLAEIAADLSGLGAPKKVEMIDRDVDGGSQICVFRFTLARGTRVFAIEFDADGKVANFFPDA